MIAKMFSYKLSATAAAIQESTPQHARKAPVYTRKAFCDDISQLILFD